MVEGGGGGGDGGGDSGGHGGDFDGFDGFDGGHHGGHDGGHHGGHDGHHGHHDHHDVQRSPLDDARRMLVDLGFDLPIDLGPGPGTPDREEKVQELDTALQKLPDSEGKCQALADFVRILHDSGDRQREARALARLAQAYAHQDSLERALDAYLRESEVWDQLHDRLSRRRALINAAECLNALGRYDEAFTVAKQAGTLSPGRKGRHDRALCLLALGTGQARSEQSEPALETFELALVDIGKLTDVPNRRLLEHRAHCGAGEALSGLGRFAEAADRYEQAEAIWERARNTPQPPPEDDWPGWPGTGARLGLKTVETLTRLERRATAYLETGDPARAREIWAGAGALDLRCIQDAAWATAVLNRMADQWRDAGDRRRQAETFMKVGTVNLANGDPAAARGFIQAEALFWDLREKTRMRDARKLIRNTDLDLPLAQCCANCCKRWSFQIKRQSRRLLRLAQ